MSRRCYDYYGVDYCNSQCGCYWDSYHYGCYGNWCDNSGSSFGTGIGIFFLVYFILSGVVGGIIFAISEIKRRENKENRPTTIDDENENTDPMNMSFEKRFVRGAEHDIIRKVIGLIYWGSRKGCFNILSILFGILFAIVWGFILGFYGFVLIWFVLPYIDIGKRMYIPCAQIVGDVMNAIYGQCLRNLRPGGKHKMDDPNENDGHNDIVGDIGGTKDDQLGMKFITAFPKSDEFKVVRKIEEIVYEIFRIGSYNILIILIGFPFSIIWGLIYGFLQFILIWIIGPSIKCYKLAAIPSARVAGACLNAMYGKCLRNMRSNPVKDDDDNNNDNIDIEDSKKPDVELETSAAPPDDTNRNINNNTYQGVVQSMSNNGSQLNSGEQQQGNIVPMQTNDVRYN